MRIKTFLMLTSVVILWGSSFALIKLGLEEIPPITLAFLRFLLATPLLVAFTYIRNPKGLDTSVLRDWRRFSLLGLTGVTLYHTFQNLGLRLTTASNSSVIIAANPIFISLLSIPLLKERMNLWKILGVALGFSGTLLIIVHEGPISLASNPLGMVGDLLSLGAGVCWALYSTLGKRMLSSHNPREATTTSIIYGTLFLFPLIFSFETPVLPTSPWLWFLLFILSFLCSGVGYLFWYQALEEVEASKAGVFLFLIPIVSVSVARTLLREPLDLSFGLGTALVMLGVIITERS
ncbi:MAG: DMT family transporter [Candidatus Bathyarchaeia archaeon]